MDLVRIMHVVDMPSAGKHDFNYLCSWFDIVHTVPLGFLCGTVHIDFHPFHNAYPMSLVSSYLFMVWFQACCSKSCGSHICVVDIASEPICNVLSIVMHPVDMGRFILPLCFII